MEQHTFSESLGKSLLKSSQLNNFNEKEIYMHWNTWNELSWKQAGPDVGTKAR